METTAIQVNGKATAADYLATVEENLITHDRAAASVQAGDKPKTILDELAAFEGDEEALKYFALDAAPRLANLKKADFERFCVALNARGVSLDWLKTLRRTVNEEKPIGVTWIDYVEAANNLGFYFRLNELGETLEVNGQRITDSVEARILSYLHAKGLRDVDVARRAFKTDADSNRYHPVKSYLESLVWDGNDHIAKLASYFTDAHDPIKYAGNSQRTVFHAWFYRWMIGAVAKVYDSRNNQNPVMILDGHQGRGKSYFVEWLCPDALSELHMEERIVTTDKDFYGYLTSKWIWEINELDATVNKQDRSALKAFLTMKQVTYRPPYAREPLNKPAMASFIGTINLTGPLLDDPSGYRRFRPLTLTGIDHRYTKNVDKNQLWAQAYALWQRGESWKLSPEEEPVHQMLTDDIAIEDPYEAIVLDKFHIDLGRDDWFMKTDDIMEAAGISVAPEKKRGVQIRLAGTLSRLGLRRGREQGTRGPRGYFGLQPLSKVEGFE